MGESENLNPSVQQYRDAVLAYEAANAEVDQLIAEHRGGTEAMSEADLARYRELARRRDELSSELRWMEQQLLDDPQT